MWRPNAAKGYINLDTRVEANVRHLFNVDMDSDSDMDVPLLLGTIENPLTGTPLP